MEEQEVSHGDALRSHFEGLLNEALQLSYAQRKCAKVPTAFREGFKFCLQSLGHIKESTKELTEEQFRKLNSRMETLLGLVPPPPDEVPVQR